MEHTRKRKSTKKALSRFFSVLVIASVAILSVAGLANANTRQLDAPTILAPGQEPVAKRTPTIAGLVQNDSVVDIYINNVLYGQAKTKNSPNGTASWSYTPTSELPLGDNDIYVVARSKDGSVVSKKSFTNTFTITEPIPTPTLKEPVVNSETTYTKPFIVGLVPSGLSVEVYINGKLDGETKPEAHVSGTSNFKYLPSYTLNPGWYSVKTRSRSGGLYSEFTDELVFEVKSPEQPKNNTLPQPPENQREKTQVPAPTLTEPKHSSVTDSSLPVISGLVHNGHSVQVFINGKLNGEVKPKNHPSGVTSFTYKPFLPLKPGYYNITARSVNKDGNKSSHSNEVSLIVKPSGKHVVISINGVGYSTPPKKNYGQTAKKTNKDSRPTSEKVENATKNNIEKKREKTADKQKNTPISVKEMGEKDTPIQLSEIPTSTPTSVVVETKKPSVKGADIVIIGDSTSGVALVDSDKKTNNTTLIIALAIMAIIIIGLISWFTSGKQESEHEEDFAEDSETGDTQTNDIKQNNPQQKQTDEQEPLWEVERTDHVTETQEQNPAQEPQEIPPPPRR